MIKYIKAIGIVALFSASLIDNALAVTQTELDYKKAQTRLESAILESKAAMTAASGLKGDDKARALEKVRIAGQAKIEANNAFWRAKHALSAEQKAAARTAANAPDAIPAGAMVVTNTVQLLATLKGLDANAKATIVLRGGKYDGFTIKYQVFGSLTIMGMPGETAVLKDIKLNQVENVTFRKLNITTDPRPQQWGAMLDVKNSKNIVVTEVNIAGPTDYLSAASAVGIGISATNVKNLTFSKSTIRDAYIGLTVGNSENVVITGNDIQELRKDGMDIIASKGVLISHNLIDKHNPVGGDHPDHIQFWAHDDSQKSSDIVIENNQLISNGAQGIFMRGTYETYSPNTKNRFVNVTIRNNYIKVSHSNGIVLSGFTNAQIENNTVVNTDGKTGLGYTTIRLVFGDNFKVTKNISNGYSLDVQELVPHQFDGNKAVSAKSVTPTNIPSLYAGYANLPDAVLKKNKTGGTLGVVVK